MITLKCKMCGGELTITDDTSVCECEYCGSKQTIPTVDDEKIMKLYDRANRLRMANEFDKAAGVYESIIEESDSEAEAYWGLLLCKYGIEYVDDPATGDKIPTCHRVSFDSIMDDEDFDLVMENSDALSRKLYREQAKQIEEIRKGIVEVSGKESPYDIFICYKETSDDGDRTVDSVIAQDVYDALTEKGYRVFFSRISLEDKLGTEYEPYIFAALNSAKIMLAFGSSYDYYNAVWVKNEWSRYLKLMAKDKDKHLIPCYKDIDAYDMPKEFKHLQAQDMGKVGAIQDLARGIGKILNKGIVRGSADVVSNDGVKTVANVIPTTGTDILLERGFMMLEDEDYGKADELFEDVLNQNPKCAEAYMGKLLAYYKKKNVHSFAEDVFDAIVSKFEERPLKLDCSMIDLIKNKYILGTDISDTDLRIKSIKTNVVSLQSYVPDVDYVEMYCSSNSVTKGTSIQNSSRYYARFKQYASDYVKQKYDVKSELNKIVKNELLLELSKFDDSQTTLSRKKLMEIIDEANAQVGHLLENDSSMSQYESMAKESYDKELRKIDEEIARNELELSKLGIFNKNHKLILNQKINALKEKKKELGYRASNDNLYTRDKVNGLTVLRKILKKEQINLYIDESEFEFGIGTDLQKLEWTVLKREGNDVLLITKKVIEVNQYNHEFKKSTWKDCDLREYLNNEFIEKTFTRDEKNNIRSVMIENKNNAQYGTLGCSDTTDKVFCLSIEEVREYFASDKDRIAIPMDDATESVPFDVKRHFKDEIYGGACWWLRSAGDTSESAACVLGDGQIDESGKRVNYAGVGIRPALWMHLD